MALFSNTTAVIRHYVSSAVGDLIYGVCGATGATTSKIHAPFLWRADDYYNNHSYSVYVYAGTNIGEARSVKDWVNTGNLLEIQTPVYDNACDATSYIELHYKFTADDYLKAINLVIEAAAGKYLIDLKIEGGDTDAITLVADTYEYELPLSLLYLYQVTTEDEVDGGEYFNADIIDPRFWSIIKSYPPKLKLDKAYYSVTADKDLRLEGQGSQPIVDDDTDVIYLDPKWLVKAAIGCLPYSKIQAQHLEALYNEGRVALENPPRNYPNPRARSVI